MVTGTIEDIGSFDKDIKGEQKTIHYIVVGGKKYEMGFYPASYGKGKPAKVGDEVTFDSEFKYGSNKVTYGSFKNAKGGVASAAPAPQNDTLRIRIAALNAAAVYCGHLDAPLEGVTGTAKAFEEYLQGE